MIGRKVLKLGLFSSVAYGFVFAATVFLPRSLQAQETLALTFPGPAVLTGSDQQSLATFALPTGPYNGKDVPLRALEGAVQRSAWRVDEASLSTLQLLTDLRAQVEEAGFKTGFSCETAGCGGFDFRFAIGILPEPLMHVDLGDFRFLSAMRGQDVVTLVISKSAKSVHVQLSTVGVTGTSAAPATPNADPIQPVQTVPAIAKGALAQKLAAGLPAVLEDLSFGSGSAALAAQDFVSLEELAAWLKENPATLVEIVGHTDASGGKSANVQLSKYRAESVRQRLIESHGVPPKQISADGAGPLAPRDTNLTVAGRAENRRVEVIVTSTP